MADTEKPMCKYGRNCYRLSEQHKNEYRHPTRGNQQTAVKRDSSQSPDSKQFKKKVKLASPRNNNQRKQNHESATDDKKKEESIKEKDSDDETEKSESDSDDNEEEPKTSSSNQKPILKHDSPKKSPSKSPARTRSPQKSSSDTGPSLLNDPLATFIKSKFLVEMPTDFYQFWTFCKSKSTDHPDRVFNKFGLQLVGPFDVLAGKFAENEFNDDEYLRHWRFFYDPPEFQTFMVKDKGGIHYGYWRDEPTGHCLVARNNAEDNGEFTFVADNIFSAVLYFLDKDIQLSPFNRSAGLAMKKSIEQWAENEKISLTSFSSKLKARNSKAVCKTFHRAGLVVPYDRKADVGYRPLIESDANIKKLLKRFNDAKGDKNAIKKARDDLEPLITAANIACDEGDFGNTIELGIDLFIFGAIELNQIALHLLSTGYTMINRPEYVKIIKAHLSNRKKTYSNLSILEHSSSTS